jgi:hypothetical protein
LDRGRSPIYGEDHCTLPLPPFLQAKRISATNECSRSWRKEKFAVYCPAGFADNRTTYILRRASRERGRVARRRRVQIKLAEYESFFQLGKALALPNLGPVSKVL